MNYKIEQTIFSCSENTNNGNKCPLAIDFYNRGNELPIPEAYLGSRTAKYMIVGLNPGETTNYLDKDFKKYLIDITQPLNPNNREFYLYYEAAKQQD
jgi:hypothetical protein